MRSFAYIVLALPILLASTMADAQRKSINQTSDEAIAARRACFAEAQARHPGNDQASPGLATAREGAYRACAKRKGIQP